MYAEDDVGAQRGLNESADHLSQGLLDWQLPLSDDKQRAIATSTGLWAETKGLRAIAGEKAEAQHAVKSEDESIDPTNAQQQEMAGIGELFQSLVKNLGSRSVPQPGDQQRFDR